MYRTPALWQASTTVIFTSPVLTVVSAPTTNERIGARTLIQKYFQSDSFSSVRAVCSNNGMATNKYAGMVKSDSSTHTVNASFLVLPTLHCVPVFAVTFMILLTKIFYVVLCQLIHNMLCIYYLCRPGDYRTGSFYVFYVHESQLARLRKA